MTRKPTPVPNGTGGYERNHARSKAGLNKALLHQCLGLILRFVKYKALRKGKLVLEVPAQGTSTECAHCGFSHPENRKKTKFLCLNCGHPAHADANASANIEERTYRALLTMLGRSMAPCVDAHNPSLRLVTANEALEAPTSPPKAARWV